MWHLQFSIRGKATIRPGGLHPGCRPDHNEADCTTHLGGADRCKTAVSQRLDIAHGSLAEEAAIFAAELALVDLLQGMPKRKSATPGQIALAWLLARRPWIVPIPGTTKLHRLEENIGAVAVKLTDNDVADIEQAAGQITVQGARYPERIEQLSNR